MSNKVASLISRFEKREDSTSESKPYISPRQSMVRKVERTHSNSKASDIIKRFNLKKVSPPPSKELDTKKDQVVPDTDLEPEDEANRKNSIPSKSKPYVSPCQSYLSNIRQIKSNSKPSNVIKKHDIKIVAPPPSKQVVIKDHSASDSESDSDDEDIKIFDGTDKSKPYIEEAIENTKTQVQADELRDLLVRLSTHKEQTDVEHSEEEYSDSDSDSSGCESDMESDVESNDTIQVEEDEDGVWI